MKIAFFFLFVFLLACTSNAAIMLHAEDNGNGALSISGEGSGIATHTASKQSWIYNDFLTEFPDETRFIIPGLDDLPFPSAEVSGSLSNTTTSESANFTWMSIIVYACCDDGIAFNIDQELSFSEGDEFAFQVQASIFRQPAVTHGPALLAIDHFIDGTYTYPGGLGHRVKEVTDIFGPLTITKSAVPEPSSLVILSNSFLLMLFRRR